MPLICTSAFDLSLASHSQAYDCCDRLKKLLGVRLWGEKPWSQSVVELGYDILLGTAFFAPFPRQLPWPSTLSNAFYHSTVLFLPVTDLHGPKLRFK